MGMLIWALVGRFGQNLSFFDWQFVTAIALGCTSVILACMAIVCAYLGKINKEVKNRPQYLVRDTNKENIVLK